jgi:hypothetical protein
VSSLRSTANFRRAADVVDELAVASPEVDDRSDSHVSLEERLTKYLPQRVLALSLSGAESLLVQVAQE